MHPVFLFVLKKSGYCCTVVGVSGTLMYSYSQSHRLLVWIKIISTRSVGLKLSLMFFYWEVS